MSHNTHATQVQQHHMLCIVQHSPRILASISASDATPQSYSLPLFFSRTPHTCNLFAALQHTLQISLEGAQNNRHGNSFFPTGQQIPRMLSQYACHVVASSACREHQHQTTCASDVCLSYFSMSDISPPPKSVGHPQPDHYDSNRDRTLNHRTLLC